MGDGFADAAQLGEFLFHSLLLAAEFGQLGSGEPFGGQGDTGGVDRHAVEAHFVVQVRAGAAAGGADEADDVDYEIGRASCRERV